MSAARTSVALFLVLLLAACQPYEPVGDDDTVDVADDDDAVDDDDSSDDDDVADDDDQADDDDVADDDDQADDYDSSDDDDAADDDDVADDDDSGADDDDSSSPADDDDATPPPPVCDDAVLEAALSTLGSWPIQISCGHSFYTGTAADTFRLGMSFSVPSVPETVGMTWSQSFDGAPLPDLVTGIFEVQAGANLTVNDCNDALDPFNQPVVAQQWDPIAGTATMTVDVVNGEAWPGGPLLFDGSVTVSSVTVELAGSPGTVCELPDTTWTGLSLGWLPG